MLVDRCDELALCYVIIFGMLLCCGCGVVKMVKISKDTGIKFMWTFLVCYTEYILPGRPADHYTDLYNQPKFIFLVFKVWVWPKYRVWWYC